MKKLFLITAVSTALLTSTTSFAEEMQENPTNQFYIKGEVGGAKLRKQKYKEFFKEIGSTVKSLGESKAKLKSKANVILGAELGYFVTDRVALGVSLNYFINPKLKQSLQVDNTAINIQQKDRMVSLLAGPNVILFKTGAFTFFGGAKVGIAQVKSKLTENEEVLGTKTTFNAHSKKSNNFAYKLEVGAGVPVFDNVNLEATYSFMGLGKGKWKKDSKIKQKPSYKSHNITVGLKVFM